MAHNTNPPRSVLLISCSDSTGLIHKITGVLYRRALNITENTEFVDHRQQSFFMRTEFEGDLNASEIIGELTRELPAQAIVELREQTPKKLVLLATKEHHCLGDLLLRHSAGELRALIQCVVSQYLTLKELTERFDIPFHYVPVEEKTREQHEAELLRVIEPYRPDFLVLAKYMRILGADFVRNFPNRILNIHHSFLPAFIGKNPYVQAYERGVKIIGATAHFVNEDLDEGPIITQSVIPINHTQDPAALSRAGKDVERIVLAKALSLVLENRVIVQGRKTLVFE
jgi:formyltetrahydrofolate deformylase